IVCQRIADMSSFFSRKRRSTRSKRDWSSDVCSSDLIASELLAQGDATGLAVLCSPALAEQWQTELRTKFNIDAELVLASTVSRLERGLDLGQSLFDKHKHVIISTDFIKSTRHRDDFVRHCPDLVIVDEAHTCVAADDTRSHQSQLRHELLQKVAKD